MLCFILFPVCAVSMPANSRFHCDGSIQKKKKKKKKGTVRVWLPCAGFKKQPLWSRCSVDPPGVAMDHECSFCYLLLLVLCWAPVYPLQCDEETAEGRLALINALKWEILHKLQISTPPNVTHVHPLNTNVYAKYNATVAAQTQVNKAQPQCAQHGRSSKELFVHFPISTPGIYTYARC